MALVADRANPGRICRVKVVARKQAGGESSAVELLEGLRRASPQRISFHQKTIGNHTLEAKLSLVVALSITSAISIDCTIVTCVIYYRFRS